MSKKRYDIAAYIWPAYTGKEPRAYQFWEQKQGEWQTVKSAKAKFEGHLWPREPLWGYQDEVDSAVMEGQIQQALSHGVNVFIYDWYWYDNRPFLEQCLNEGFLQAKNNQDMKFCLMWANHDASTSWDKRIADINEIVTVWSGKVTLEQFKYIAKRNIEKYFTKENYYTIDGRPVFIIYDMNNFVNGLGGLEYAQKALAYLKDETKKMVGRETYIMFILADSFANLSGVEGEKIDQEQEVLRVLKVDGLTHYQMAHFTDVNRDYEQIIPDMIQEWEKQGATQEIPYYPHVSIGWDNNPRFKDFMENITKNNTPKNFEKALVAVKEYINGANLPAPFITINSWNEWTESSYLSPDNLYGYGYLEAIKKTFLEEE